MGWQALLAVVAADVAVATAAEHAERWTAFRRAREAADRLGLPLLNFGCGTLRPYVDLADVNADVVLRRVPNFVLVGRGGRLPLRDKSVVTFCSHVLEHVERPEETLRELERVSAALYVALPKWWNASAWLHPGHRRVYVGGLAVEGPQSVAGPLLAGALMLALSLDF
jgi:SAM-dependent methyltransferase